MFANEWFLAAAEHAARSFVGDGVLPDAQGWYEEFSAALRGLQSLRDNGEITGDQFCAAAKNAAAEAEAVDAWIRHVVSQRLGLDPVEHDLLNRTGLLGEYVRLLVVAAEMDGRLDAVEHFAEPSAPVAFRCLAYLQQFAASPVARSLLHSASAQGVAS